MDTKMSISEAKRRAKELLAQLSLDEKLYQLSSQMIYSVEDDYEQKRNPMQGNYRNPGHFMHHGRKEAVTPAQVTERINRDVKMIMDAQPHAIHPLSMERLSTVLSGEWLPVFLNPSVWLLCLMMRWPHRSVISSAVNVPWWVSDRH